MIPNQHDTALNEAWHQHWTWGKGGEHRRLLKYHKKNLSCGCRTSIWLSIYDAMALFASSLQSICVYRYVGISTHLNSSNLFRWYIVLLARLVWETKWNQVEPNSWFRLVPQMRHVRQTMYQRKLAIVTGAFREEGNYRDHCTVVPVIHFPPQITYFCVCSTKNVKLVKLYETGPKTCPFFTWNL